MSDNIVRRGGCPDCERDVLGVPTSDGRIGYSCGSCGWADAVSIESTPPSRMPVDGAPRYRPYKDEHCFQDIRTLQVYRVEYCQHQHVSESCEVADADLGWLVRDIVDALNRRE